MSRLKMLILTVIAAVTVGTGALAAAPSASARPPTCSELYRLYLTNYNIWNLLVHTGYGQTQTAAYYKAQANDYLHAGC